MTTFNAATFTCLSFTQELHIELKMGVKPFRFGLFREFPEQAASAITTIAFGVILSSGVKHRLGSVTIEDDYILVLSMDGTGEYRARDKWDCMAFLNALATTPEHNWDDAQEKMPNLRYLPA